MVLCSNRLSTAQEVEEVLLHELIHLYDLKVKGLDFSKCPELAFSEIRAARESECKIGSYSTTSALCSGVRDRLASAASSSSENASEPPPAASVLASFCSSRLKKCSAGAAVNATSNMFPYDVAKKCVEQTFGMAYNDMSPWGGSPDASTTAFKVSK